MAAGEANFSGCGRYRYDLWRGWGEHPRPEYVLWVMLNPSVATAVKDDATIRKCMGFTARLGYTGMWVVNLFAFISTHPGVLLQRRNPVGERNDHYITMHGHIKHCALTIAAWGSLDFIPRRSKLRGRVKEVMQLLQNGVQCLGVSKSGDPRHPSRIGYNTKLVPFQGWES